MKRHQSLEGMLRNRWVRARMKGLDMGLEEFVDRGLKNGRLRGMWEEWKGLGFIKNMAPVLDLEGKKWTTWERLNTRPRGKYRGITFERGGWKAEITIDGRRKYLGRFSSEERAAKAYDEESLKRRGFKVNFP